MKNFILYTILFTAIICLPAFANIIDIPDDYPTIQQGIDASTDGDTVLVQPGTYVENINFNGHNIVLGSLFLTTGDTTYIFSTIIDGDSSGSVVTFGSGESESAIIIGFTIINGSAEYGGGIFCVYSTPVIKNNVIMNNHADDGDAQGGGIFCDHSDAIIIGNRIENNIAFHWYTFAGIGGGVFCINSEPTVKDNIFRGNGALLGGGMCYTLSSPDIMGNTIEDNIAAMSFGQGGNGGGILCYNSNPRFNNNTITRNLAYNDGGGIYCAYSSNPTIFNTIFWANDAEFEHPEIFVDDSSSPVINYSNIQGGWEGEGNIDIDPLFRGPENDDFHLMSTACGDSYDSPCIDAGHPDILDSLLDCSWGLGTILGDMGAYGGGDSVTVGIDFPDIRLPEGFSISQNYPNPFNTMTVFHYSLPEPSNVIIEIYDILGRMVETLVNTKQQAGYHQAVWDATDRSSGIYFYRIQAGDYSETRKMVLLK